MTNKRKHILLKNEIEMIQLTLKKEVYPSEEYILRLVERLEKLKRKWYKIKYRGKIEVSYE